MIFLFLVNFPVPDEQFWRIEPSLNLKRIRRQHSENFGGKNYTLKSADYDNDLYELPALVLDYGMVLF